jgi:hypothetical protein
MITLKSVVEVIPRVDTPTTIFGVPERPKEVVAKLAVDAVPVKLPTKLVAVMTPALAVIAVPTLNVVAVATPTFKPSAVKAICASYNIIFCCSNDASKTCTT